MAKIKIILEDTDTGMKMSAFGAAFDEHAPDLTDAQRMLVMIKRAIEMALTCTVGTQNETKH
ncbi:hypothetical protein [Neisseria animalis]|uniref:Uncharacterized protein n=1 Tax=Neisseria animalis TaxID=492 RepID=A0A5P3MSC2_NEIAN|nr:hypothetical protein [Neisseria animalis]QEY23539.1 hypothetical protein D0T90_02670 [Neisseria animalis]ROW32139.1 hypothetical protein CGZ60_06050 [Neisseria animalis]VEE09173.1 Uncharacterised protein [Neisseria animalis]